MEFDLHSSVQAVNALDVAAARTDGTDDGNVIDTLGFESLEYIIQTGTITDGTHTVLLEESDVVTFGGEETVVPAAETLGALPVIVAADDDTVFRVGSVGKKRFQRLSIVTTGATTGGVTSAVAILGHARTKPVADQST